MMVNQNKRIMRRGGGPGDSSSRLGTLSRLVIINFRIYLASCNLAAPEHNTILLQLKNRVGLSADSILQDTPAT